MKQRVLALIIAFLIVGCVAMLLYTLYDNDRLNGVITEQKAFIKELTGKDSVFIDQSKKYKDSLSKFTQRFTYTINGKVVNSHQFFSAYIKLRRERDSLNALLNYARDVYGFKVYYKRLNDSTYETGVLKFSKADSADMTYSFFKDRIKKDKKGYWTADQTSKKDLDYLNGQIERLGGKVRAIVDTSKSKL